jgi:hypothetical protein
MAIICVKIGTACELVGEAAGETDVNYAAHKTRFCGSQQMGRYLKFSTPHIYAGHISVILNSGERDHGAC